jgi:hypothetical protein
MSHFRILPAVLLLLSLCPVLLFADIYYVSPDGDDANAGTQSAPFRTINRGAASAMPGDTVFVQEGIYRERVVPPRGGEEGRPITFKGEPGKQVFIKGSEIWSPDWIPQGEGVYYAVPDPKLFNDRSDEYIDGHNPFKVFLASTPHQRQGAQEVERGFGGDPDLRYTCGQVFVNDEEYLEVPFLDELSPGAWYFEQETDRLYVHFSDSDPAEQTVEITTRRRIFAPTTRGLGYITVEGFVMEHAGNQYPTNFWVEDRYAQKGAMGFEAGHHWIVRDNVIRRAKTFALDAGYVDRHTGSLTPHDNLIERNYITENGAAGILSNSSLNMIVRENVITYNNTLGFLGDKRWEQAGVKCHNFKEGLIADNFIAYNYLTYGIWLDNQFPDGRVSRNVLLDNGRAGLFLEMSDYEYDRFCVDNNLMIGNVENPVYIHDASGATFLHNLFANTRNEEEHRGGLHVRQCTTRTRTRHHSFYNNLFLGNSVMADVSYPSDRSGPQKFDFNVYETTPNARTYAVSRMTDNPSPWTTEEFVAMINEELGGASPGIDLLSGLRRAMLTFEEWQVFWNIHDLPNDVNSRLCENASVRFEPVGNVLTIDVPFDPESIGSQNHRFADVDFCDETIPQDGQAVPGPFQNLKQGPNSFHVWDGMPVLPRGELP